MTAQTRGFGPSGLAGSAASAIARRIACVSASVAMAALRPLATSGETGPRRQAIADDDSGVHPPIRTLTVGLGVPPTPEHASLSLVAAILPCTRGRGVSVDLRRSDNERGSCRVPSSAARA